MVQVILVIQVIQADSSDASKSSAALSRLSSSFLKTNLSEMTSCKLRFTEIDSRQKQ